MIFPPSTGEIRGLHTHAVGYVRRRTKDNPIARLQPGAHFDIAAVIRFKLKLAKLDLAVGDNGRA
jgi:hypothetical protein